MATKHPRLMLTLRPELRQLVDRLSAIQGKSRNRVITDLLEEFRPVLEKVVVLTEAAKKAEFQASGALKLSATKAESVIESHAKASLDQLDMLMGQVESAVQGTSVASPEHGRARRKTNQYRQDIWDSFPNLKGKPPAKRTVKTAGKRKRAGR